MNRPLLRCSCGAVLVDHLARGGKFSHYRGSSSIPQSIVFMRFSCSNPSCEPLFLRHQLNILVSLHSLGLTLDNYLSVDNLQPPVYQSPGLETPWIQRRNKTSVVVVVKKEGLNKEED